jgi:3-hydroxybutyryl-CoA dehydrogenase
MQVLQRRWLNIGVLGAGQMGIGIAYVAALSANKVIIYDSQPSPVEKGLKFIDSLLLKNVSKGKISDDESKAARENISSTRDLNGFSKCDFIIEAVSENPALKRELFLSLDRIAAKHCILASNTSSISITVFSIKFRKLELRLSVLIKSLACIL